MGEYRLRPSDLSELGVYEVNNPYYKKAPAMQLYLLTQIEELAQAKHGSKEPYTVALAGFTDEQVEWFEQDLDRLKQLTPEEFQYLVADRLDHLGLSVQIVGNVYRKDGGIDIIAYPRIVTVPFLVAVQVKHHRTARTCTVSDVRDLHGALTSRTSPFNLGIIVTNTTFTVDAKWFADNNRAIVRLRDNEDLRRWLKKDFVNEHEWREIPDKVELAPGITIEIPKKELWLPTDVKQR